MKCELCNLKVKSKLYYQDDFMIIVTCLSCGRPLIVFKKHKPTLSVLEELHMLKVLKKLFNYYSIDKVLDNVDKTMRSLTDHVHWHWRKDGR